MTHFELDAHTQAILEDLVRWVRRFFIMYGALWLTLCLAFFLLLLRLLGGRQ